jgi:hypothetical protein
MFELQTISSRAFKTSLFAKSARKADIRDAELCTAIRQVGVMQ